MEQSGTSAIRVGGIVLCGGRSRRMGTSKAWLGCGGEYLLPRVARILAGVVEPVVVAARRGQTLPALPPDVLRTYDAAEHCGPLGGIAAGFEVLAGRCEAAFVVSCDQPLIRTVFVARLIELLGDYTAVVPQHQGRLHPLTAVYRLETRPVLSELLTRQDWRVQHFADRCGAHIVAASDLIPVDPNLDSLRNVNDADTYESVIRELADE